MKALSESHQNVRSSRAKGRKEVRPSLSEDEKENISRNDSVANLESVDTNAVEQEFSDEDVSFDTANEIQVASLQPIAQPDQCATTMETEVEVEQEQQLPAETKPAERLVIDKLVLTNFKSYAGKQTIGPFDASFSAVVGPNGSGKSNVIDSLLFVFGFRATKMRQSKLSELIHKSENFPNLEFCAVDIYFKLVVDNEDATSSDIADSTLLVSRRAFKNNGSKYYINNMESTYSIVTKMLRDKGIDLDHKRFLILQGEVESIAQMKPKAENGGDDGLLEYLEDIIGTADYKGSIEQSLGRAAELNEVCREKEGRFKIVEDEKSALEDKKDGALEFLKKEKELLHYRSIQLQYEQAKYSKEQTTVEETVSGLADKLNQERTETQEYEQEIKDMIEEHHGLKQSLEKLTKQVSSLEKSYRQIQREKMSLDEKLKHLETKKKKASKSLASNEQSVREAEANTAQIEKEQEDFQSQLNSLDKQLAKEKEELESARLELADKTQAFTLEVEELKEVLEPWIEKLNSKDSQIAVLQSELEMLVRKKNESATELARIQEQIEALITQGKDKKRQALELREENKGLPSKIKQGKFSVENASRKLEEFHSEASTLRQKVSEARNNLSSDQNKSKVLTALGRLKQTGRIEGFYGRLGDLGAIDEKYDVAISTACPGLDSMVVQTVQTGRQCLEYLRNNNLGYGRFLVLDELRRGNMNPIQTPRNVPRLFDLVKPVDSKFAPAFYDSLGDTLVAANLEEAKSVAYGARRWRVVTIDGKVIDVSGTLSGGGDFVNKGGMKSSNAGNISEAEIEQLEKTLNDKEAFVKQAEDVYDQMVTHLRDLEERKPEIETELAKLSMDADAIATEIQALQRTAQEIIRNTSNSSEIDEAISQTESKLATLRVEREELKAGAAKIEQEIKEVENKIMDVGGVKLRMLHSKVDSALQKKEIVQKQFQSHKTQLKKLAGDLTRLAKAAASYKKDIEDCESESDKLTSSNAENDSEFVALEAQIGSLQGEREDVISSIEKTGEELDLKEKRLAELRSGQIEIENKLEKHQGYLKSVVKKLGTIQEELDSFEIRTFDENELEWLEEKDEARNEIDQSGILSRLTPDEIDDIKIDDVEAKIANLEDYMEDVKVDLDVLQEYSRRYREYNSRKSDLNNAVSEREREVELAETLKKKRYTEFMAGFHTISMTLKEMYQMITMGGNAELELVDSLDPFSEGILFSVMPPKKSWKNISNLSGGEKTLSSLALVFSLHRYKPTPLYVMDEIDAALDFRNVSIVANYIKDRTKNAQFIVISLRNNMFELAKQLVGVYKVNNMTKSISLQNREMVNEQSDPPS
ncbi:unnamed protein product [Kuraishia capsulata CBS 1993]|uniref:Structural maintenance of chromosomes protein n=1 Tax=Kuraishia capsulata CBS 1993 TaxID=1382522 RepID=W6MTS1_9ASCO|nr:uncharacterized protein KUCA_T00005877001 [Kuraishia capsulata CBS 1993]CDK29883.1 unnamed protein product [Kuraishia capsulata CBS 1993]